MHNLGPDCQGGVIDSTGENLEAEEEVAKPDVNEAPMAEVMEPEVNTNEVAASDEA